MHRKNTGECTTTPAFFSDFNEFTLLKEMRRKDNRFNEFESIVIRGRESGGAPRAVDERMSADEQKQHDCDHKVIARSFKPLCIPKNALN